MNLDNDNKELPLIQKVSKELLYAIEPLTNMTPESFAELLAILGVPIADAATRLIGLIGEIAGFADALAKIEDWSSIESYMEPLQKLTGLISSLETFFSSIKNDVSAVVGFVENIDPADMANRLIDYLIVNYLLSQRPMIFSILSLLGIIEYDYDPDNLIDHAFLPDGYGESAPDIEDLEPDFEDEAGDNDDDDDQPVYEDKAPDDYQFDSITYEDSAAVESAWASIGGIGSDEDLPVSYQPAPQPNMTCKIHWDKIINVIKDPLSAPRELYDWGGDFAGDRFINTLYTLLRVCGLPAGLRSPEPADGTHIASQKILSAMLLSSSLGGTGGASLTAEAAAIKKDGKSGLIAYLAGDLNSSIPLTDYLKLNLTSKLAQGAGLSILPGNISFVSSLDGSSDASATASAELILQKPEPGVFYIFGDGTGISMSVKSIGFKLDLAASPSFDFGFGFDIKKLSLSFAGGGDGFLAKLLPSDPISFDADLGVAYSKQKGFSITGAIGGEITFELNKTISIITLKSVTIRFDGGFNSDGGAFISIKGTVAVGAKLGPLSAVVSGIGVELKLLFGKAMGDKPGNLSKDVRLEPNFVMPTGVGLSLDASVISGGGFLSIENGRYFGVLQLKIMDFGISVIGLLDTKDASGEPLKSGYSLLLIVCFNLPPIQLGFGFVLTGIGGLLALNRTIALEELRSQMRERALGHIMFPTDPVAQAPTIEKSLSKIFPPADGIFVIAPMVQIGWGSPTPLIKVELGLMFELPSFNKIVLIARLRMALPNEEKAVAVINLDALGILQFDEGKFSLDAQLYDSRITELKLSGEMALRLNWKGKKEFLFSMGGYHPAFVAPPGFPKLERMAATLAIGNWFSLRLEAYVAVTSNSFQFGARCDLQATLGPIKGKASLYFDTLIYFNPFRLQIDIGASISVSIGSVTLLAISFSGHISGPSPWYISGEASFKILGIGFSFKLEATIGKPAPPEQLDPVDVGSLLLDEVDVPENWSALPPDGYSALIMRGLSEDEETHREVVVHPMGSLQFNQKVVPLGVDLEKFGDAPIGSGKKFFINEVRLGGSDGVAPAQTDALTEDFAPAQFFNFTETEKLKSPSFEEYESGFRVCFEGLDYEDSSRETDFEYETIIFDTYESGSPGKTSAVMADISVATAPAPLSPITAFEMSIAAGLSPSALASRKTENSRMQAGGLAIRVKTRKYVVRQTATDILGRAEGAVTFAQASGAVKSAARRGSTADIISVWE